MISIMTINKDIIYEWKNKGISRNSKIKKIKVQKLQSKGIKLYTIHTEKRKEFSLPWYSEESITWFI